MDEENKPFLCIEVNENDNLDELADKFNQLFPDKTIRLIINKQYTPYFYHQQKWLYKQPSKKLNFEMKLMLDENVLDFIEDDLLMIIKSLNINVEELKIIRDPIICKEHCIGMFFTNGLYHIVDQFLMTNCESFIENLKKFTEVETVLDVSNNENTGVYIIKTNKNILGEIE